MHRLSNNLKIFGGLVLLYTLVFRHFYGLFVTSSDWRNVAILAGLYGLSIFVTGLILGAKDPIRSTRTDQAFAYHLVTYIVVNVTRIVWIILAPVFGAADLGSSLLMNVSIVLSWGVGLLIHYLIVQRTIKGIPREEIFD